jgi:hypothetical protein
MTSGGNVFVGDNAGRDNTTGDSNNFLGTESGLNNTSGGANNFFGYFAGRRNTTGFSNNFFGSLAGSNNTVGQFNNFFGYAAGQSNTVAFNNNFFGQNAGQFTTTGGQNNFFGSNAGRNNTTGTSNNFFGTDAGINNRGGAYNIMMGSSSGNSNISGSDNVFLGQSVGFRSRTGDYNIFLGFFSGFSNYTGSENIAIGRSAAHNTTAADSLSGSNNVVLGTQSARNIASSAAGNLVLGNSVNLPTGNGSNQVVIKNLIFGTGASGTGTTIQTTAKAGINVNNPQSTLDVEGNTGIGTSSPQRRLHITGTVRVDTLTRDVPTRIVGADADGDLAALTLGTGFSISSGTLNGPSVSGTTNYLPKFTGASSIGNSVIQESGGNIGISATPSAFKLDINGSTHTTGDFYADRASRSASAGFVSAQTNNRWLSGMISNSGSWHVYDLLKSTSVMTLDSATSRVGIGTTSPDRTLHVNSTDALKLPAGTTAERPSVGITGDLRMNTSPTVDSLEYYNGASWVTVQDKLQNPVTGTGTANYLPKFTGASSVGNSPLYNEFNSRVSHGHAGYSDFLSIKNAYHLYGNGSTADDQPIHFIEGNVGTTAARAPQLRLMRSRAITVNGSGGQVQFGDYLGYLSFWPNENTQFRQASAYIAAVIDSITGANDFPTSIRFAVAPNGSEGAVERVTINNAGHVGIGTTSPSRTLHVEGEARISDLTTDTPTRIVGADADGDLAALTLGTGLSIASGTLNTSAILPADTSVFARDWQIAGTANYLPKFTGASSVGNSAIFEDGGNIGIGTTSINTRLAVVGGVNIAGALNVSARFSDNVNSSLYISHPGGTNNTATIVGNYQLGLATSTGTVTTERVRVADNGHVGIGTTSPSRTLHISATDAVRIPVGTAVQRLTSANGDVRFNSDSTVLEFYDGTGWRKPIVTNRGNGKGVANSFLKFDAASFADTSAVLTQSNGRIGIGKASPAELLDINGDILVNGMRVGKGPLSLSSNVAFGSSALNSVDDASVVNNVAIGSSALTQLRDSSIVGSWGQSNIAIGASAMGFTRTGYNNTAIGVAANLRCTNCIENVAIGGFSLTNNIRGTANMAIGNGSMIANIAGAFNVAIGPSALAGLTSGQSNVGFGGDAGRYINSGTLLDSATQSIFIGRDTRAAAQNETNQIVIGHAGRGNGSNTTTIGNTSTTATYLPAGSLYINGTVSPARTLHVNGEARISDLATDTPTRIVGADADGDLGAVTLGTGLSISSGTLNASGISSVYIPINIFAAGDTVKNTTTAKEFFLVHAGLNGYCIDSYTVKAITGTGGADIQIDKNGSGGNGQSISGTTVYTKDTNISLATGDYIRGQVFNSTGTLIGLGLTLEIKATCN